MITLPADNEAVVLPAVLTLETPYIKRTPHSPFKKMVAVSFLKEGIYSSYAYIYILAYINTYVYIFIYVYI